ncbi:hypothetical protein K488DRAFT_72029 [Vararia minispora EC-137]|uniref:Uncharacterized protein n=1 Tax=Vararia minispora EC-137 TaxID=1314806 RepID=A0ACB8QGB0_9AGAM|nr:hypothetical protein K488DRAFT_72029 [Vararia minispora EC-137]
MSMARVSRQWRSAALASPDLWTRIPLWCTGWVRTMLVRAHSRPMTMLYADHYTCGDACHPSEEAIALLAAAPTLRAIVCEEADDRTYAYPVRGERASDLFNTMMHIVRARPPMLDSISIMGTAGAQVVLNPVQWVLNIPALRSLELTNCLLFLAAPVPWAALHTLVLQDCAMWPSSTLMVSALASPGLRSLRRLESRWTDARRSSVVWYENMKTWAEVILDTAFRKVALPDLQTLVFQDVFPIVLCLLQHTALPPTADVFLTSGWFPDVPAAQAAAVALSQHLAPDPAQPRVHDCLRCQPCRYG